MKQYILSVDLGQMNDPTAISILEERLEESFKQSPMDVRHGTRGERKITRVYALRHLERPPLRTTYDQIVDKVKALIETPALRGNAELIIDATGVGRPVLDMMVRAGLSPIGITITGGRTVSQDEDGYHVPKRDLASALQVAFASRRMKLAAGLPLAAEFMKELEAFRVKITKAGTDTYEAWRETDHDDIVLSVAMGVWYATFTRAADVVDHPVKDGKTREYDILRHE